MNTLCWSPQPSNIFWVDKLNWSKRISWEFFNYMLFLQLNRSWTCYKRSHPRIKTWTFQHLMFHVWQMQKSFLVTFHNIKNNKKRCEWTNKALGLYLWSQKFWGLWQITVQIFLYFPANNGGLLVSIHRLHYDSKCDRCCD